MSEGVPARLISSVLHIDAALDWMQLSAGQMLFEQGDKSTDFYIIISKLLSVIFYLFLMQFSIVVPA